MKLLDYTITLSNPTHPLTLIPFGCVHRDDPGFVEPLFRQCITDLATPNTYGIGMGDYKNFLRSTARRHLKSYVEDEESFRELDTLVKDDERQFAKQYLQPVAQKLIGLAEGNHYHEFRDGTTDTQFLCGILNTNYLDKPAFIRLKVQARFGQSIKTLRILKMLVHHGDWSMGTSRVGGDVTSVETKSLGFGDFDIFLFGHTHRLWGMHIPTLSIPTVGELKLQERPRVFIRTGCFMRGFNEQCVRSYAHKKLLPPTELGYAKLTIQFYREYDADRYLKKRERDGATNGQVSNWKYKYSLTY